MHDISTKLINNKSWNEFLEIEHDFYSLDELIKVINKMKIMLNDKTWKEISKNNERIPIKESNMIAGIIKLKGKLGS